MVTVGERAKDYVPKKIKTIAELPEFSTDNQIYDDGEGLDKNEKKYKYSYLLINGERFRFPDTVLADLKLILAENPKVKRFKVKSSGTGLDTSYTVITL